MSQLLILCESASDASVSGTPPFGMKLKVSSLQTVMVELAAVAEKTVEQFSDDVRRWSIYFQSSVAILSHYVTGTCSRSATSMRKDQPSKQKDCRRCEHVVFWREDAQWSPVSPDHSQQSGVDEWLHTSKSIQRACKQVFIITWAFYFESCMLNLILAYSPILLLWYNFYLGYVS